MTEQIRPCPKCRGDDLERRWCEVCNGAGVVKIDPARERVGRALAVLWRQHRDWRTVGNYKSMRAQRWNIKTKARALVEHDRTLRGAPC